MGIARQPFPANFTTEVVQLLLRQPSFQKSPRIETGAGVPLKKEQIVPLGVIGPLPEVVKADTEHVGQRGEAGDMSAKVAIGAIRPHDHRHGIPSHPRT